jgi:hypothetical protein
MVTGYGQVMELWVTVVCAKGDLGVPGDGHYRVDHVRPRHHQLVRNHRSVGCRV